MFGQVASVGPVKPLTAAGPGSQTCKIFSVMQVEAVRPAAPNVKTGPSHPTCPNFVKWKVDVRPTGEAVRCGGSVGFDLDGLGERRSERLNLSYLKKARAGRGTRT